MSLIKIDDCEILKNESLKNYCSFKIGGIADYVIIANSKNGLINACKFCFSKKMRYKVIGLGANLLFDDLGFKGAIIINKSNSVLIKNSVAYVDSGTNLSYFLSLLCEHQLSGFETLFSIPATIGGAIFNNLGAYGTEIKDKLDYVVVLRKCDFKIFKIKNQDCMFEYRKSIFKDADYIILRAKFSFEKKPKCDILSKMKEFANKKLSSQPLNYPSAGSIFKRGNLLPAKIIDDLGLKGFAIGGAEISTKHSGFIINKNNATSNDVKALIKYINQQVFLHYNQKFNTEIEFVDYNLT